jgi:cell division protein FtsL
MLKKMENENRVHEAEAPQAPATPKAKTRRFGIRSLDAGRYIRYVAFLVAIGMFYIWNSHQAEKQVREEAKLRKEIADAKAEYKTIHARLSAGTRRQVISEKVDSLGLKSTSKNVYKLTKAQ